MNSLHMQSAAPLHAVRVNLRDFVAAPFALPVLPGWYAAGELSEMGGTLPDAGAVARTLHERAGLGSDTQMLYVFHRLIDSSTLARLLAPTGQRTMAEAMCADALTIASGGQSQLDALIPHAELRGAPLGFLVGTVFTDAMHVHPLTFPRKGWWPHSAAREDIETQLAIQLAALGIPLAQHPTPSAPTGFGDALVDGLVAILHARAGQAKAAPRVMLEGRDTVHITFGDQGSRISLSRSTVGDAVLEHLLDELSVCVVPSTRQAAPDECVH